MALTYEFLESMVNKTSLKCHNLTDMHHMLWSLSKCVAFWSLKHARNAIPTVPVQTWNVLNTDTYNIRCDSIYISRCVIPTSYCLVSTMVCCHLIRLQYYHKSLRLLPSVRHKSCQPLYFWTYTILKLLATNVYHIETMCGMHVTSIFVSW